MKCSPLVACLLAVLAVASAEESHEDKQKGASAPADPLAGMDDPQTLSQLLQWSLANQDLDALHEKAEQIRKQGGAGGGAGGGQSLDGLPVPEGGSPAAASILQKMTDQRKAELKEAMGQMMPDSVQAMRDALAAGTDASLSVEEREEGLLVLQDFIEDIDHAKDLKSIGGFPEVIALLAADGVDMAPLQAASAYIIGSSVKNARELQLHLLEEKALPSLLNLLRSHADTEVRAKALYAIAALTRNCPEAQAAFGEADGVGALLGVLAEGGASAGSGSGGGARLVRKALALVADLLREDRQRRDAAEGPTGGGGEASMGEPLKVKVVTQAVNGEGGSAGEDDAASLSSLPSFSSSTGLGSLDLWRNASELCSAVASSLRSVADLDAQEKAVQALEQLVAAGVLDDSGGSGGGGGGGGGCVLGEVRDALGGYMKRCEDAIEAAERRGQEDEDEQDGVGNCPELLPTAKGLERALKELEARQ